MKVVCWRDKYATADLAMAAGHRRLKASKGKGKKGSHISTYRCDACGLFHYGSVGTKTTPHRIKRKRRAKP